MADDEAALGAGESTTQGAATGDSGAGSPSDAGAKDAHSESQGVDAEKAKLEKRIADLERLYRGTQSDRDKTAAQLAKATDALTKLATEREGSAKQSEDRQRQEALEDARKRYEAGEMPLDELLEWNRAILRAETGTEIESLKSELKDAREAIQSIRVEFDPAYQAHKDQVDEYVTEFGVDRATALKMVSKFNTAPKQPARPPIPGGSGSPVISGGTEAPKLNEATVAHLRSIYPNLKPEELKKVADAMAAKKKGGR